MGHGEVFHYQTPKTDAASWVTCRVTGRSLLDDLHQLWSAIGADGEAYMLLDSAGMPVAGGGLNATAEDLARAIGTISYEVFTSVSPRVRRVYVQE